jgi:pumilio family protein 6
LAGYYANLSQSKYGRFIVSKILQYCSQKYRNLVITDFYGKVRKLIRHKEASLILDEAYSQFANATQRAHLMEEFYGPEFAIFKNVCNVFHFYFGPFSFLLWPFFISTLINIMRSS